MANPKRNKKIKKRALKKLNKLKSQKAAKKRACLAKLKKKENFMEWISTYSEAGAWCSWDIVTREGGPPT